VPLFYLKKNASDLITNLKSGILKMNFNPSANRSLIAGSILALLAFINFSGTARAQMVYVLDQFEPAGTGGNSCSAGDAGDVGGHQFQ
jgi:hypothetical protein